MTKKISRRNFLKGISKLTTALAAIWAVSPPLLDDMSSEAPPVEEIPKMIWSADNGNGAIWYALDDGICKKCNPDADWWSID